MTLRAYDQTAVATPGSAAQMPARSLVLTALLCIIGLLVGASLAQDIMLYGAAVPDLGAKIWRLDVDAEQSVYTWFSSSLILANAGLIALIALDRRARGEMRLWLHWTALAAIFLLLSADEALSLHEWVSRMLSRRIDSGGIFHFVWIVPAAILCLAGALTYIPFIRSFPLRPRLWLLAAAAIYLAGAIGMEALGGAWAEQQGITSLSYRLLTNVEEALEGLGMVAFLNSLLLFREAEGMPAARRP